VHIEGRLDSDYACTHSSLVTQTMHIDICPYRLRLGRLCILVTHHEIYAHALVPQSLTRYLYAPCAGVGQIQILDQVDIICMHILHIRMAKVDIIYMHCAQVWVRSKSWILWSSTPSAQKCLQHKHTSLIASHARGNHSQCVRHSHGASFVLILDAYLPRVRAVTLPA
jgi:hypothetical protein